MQYWLGREHQSVVKQGLRLKRVSHSSTETDHNNLTKLPRTSCSVEVTSILTLMPSASCDCFKKKDKVYGLTALGPTVSQRGESACKRHWLPWDGASAAPRPPSHRGASSLAFDRRRWCFQRFLPEDETFVKRSDLFLLSQCQCPPHIPSSYISLISSFTVQCNP